ncbi:MAG: PepSY domain-containing protein [Rhodospirillaceae bacterium]|nr:PepSY domain-containing protein [Rhodospirillaceae bacterium]
MRIIHILPALLVLFVVLEVVSPAAYAGGDKDHDKARRVLAQKEILPLDQVLAKVKAAVPGDVIDVELEEDDNVWVYEFKIIEPAGKVVKVNADAKTGAILNTKRK